MKKKERNKFAVQELSTVAINRVRNSKIASL